MNMGWKQFLSKDEKIKFGSQVERSKMFGITKESYVMLLTGNKRVLLIDHTKMKLRKEIATVRIVGVDCHDKLCFSIKTV